VRGRGFTFLEVTIAAAIMTVVAGVGLSLIMTGQQAYTSSSNQTYASTRANAIMERMLAEIRMASIGGEDMDGDDDPDDIDFEDVNDNGRIDDDWTLADGETAESITFNMMLAGGRVTDLVRFRFDGDRLWRESGSDPLRKSLIAEDAEAVTFTRQGSRIIINVVTSAGVVSRSEGETDRGGRQVSLLRELFLRN